MKICVPLSLFLPLFKLAHTHSHSAHPGIFKTFENVRKYFFWAGRYKWIVYFIEDCIECQTKKSKHHDLHEALLEQWGELKLHLSKQFIKTIKARLGLVAILTTIA